MSKNKNTPQLFDVIYSRKHVTQEFFYKCDWNVILNKSIISVRSQSDWIGMNQVVAMRRDTLRYCFTGTTSVHQQPASKQTNKNATNAGTMWKGKEQYTE